MKPKKSLFDTIIQVASILSSKIEETKTAKPQIEDAEFTVVETKINQNPKIQQ